MELETLLKSARDAGNISHGTTHELNSKALLALNLRKLGDDHLNWAPRSYIVLPADARGAASSEFDAFLRDFQMSRAIAVLQHVAGARNETAAAPSQGEPEVEAEPAPEAQPEPEAEPDAERSYLCGHDDTQRPEGLWDRDTPTITWEPRPQHPIDRESVDVALSVVGRLADRCPDDPGTIQSCSMSQPEWVQLRSCQLGMPAAADVTYAQRAAAGATLSKLPANTQLCILRENVWLLKPSLNGGGNGRGILLFDRLPEGTPAEVVECFVSWVVSVGRAGTGGSNDAKHGYILQKAVENPHLLDRSRLVEHWPRGFPRPHASMPIPKISKRTCQQMYKWNWRVWVLGSMGADPGPSAWLYRESYLDLTGLPFTRKLLAGAHVSNLQPPGRYFASFQRQWDLRALDQYFLHSHDADTEEGGTVSDVLMPQVHAIVCAIFQSLGAAPSSLLPPDAGKGTIKRFGLDFLVDEQLRVWLIEVNVLKGRYGLGIVKGTNGDMEREMVLEMVKAEEHLKRTLKQQARVDATETLRPLETGAPADQTSGVGTTHALSQSFIKLV